MYNCSVVIPVYNSQNSLPILIEKLSEALPGIVNEYEIIFVNDGSQDQSWQVIEKLSKENEFIHGIDLIRNFGQHNALLCGIRQAKHEVIVTMDDDLQNPPEEISKLLQKLAEGYDVVYGSPKETKENFWRKISSKLIRLVLSRILSAELAQRVSSFRAFRTTVRDAFEKFSSPTVFIDVLLAWGGSKITYVEVRNDSRKEGISTYTFRKLINLAVTMITRFSTLPLRAASITGFFFTLFGIGVLFYVVLRYLIEGGSIPGFPFLASVISIFSGATMFSLGIMGEYLAQLYTQSLGRPPYVIREEHR